MSGRRSPEQTAVAAAAAAGPRFVQPLPAGELRARAERFAGASRIEPGRSPEELRKQLHELEVSQIELDMQNIALAELQTQKDYIEHALAQFKDLYELAPSCYLVLAPTGRIVRANGEAGRLLGLAPAQLSGRAFVEFADAGQQRTLAAYLERINGGGGSALLPLELTLRTGRGALRVVRLAANRDPRTQLCRLLMVEPAGPADRGALTRATVGKLGAVRESVYIIDAANRIQYVNPTFTARTGYTPDEVLGRHAAFVSGGSMPRAVQVAAWRALERRGYWRGEVNTRRKDGSFVPESASAMLVRDGDGQFDHCVVVLAPSGGVAVAAAAPANAALHQAQRALLREALRREQAERAQADGESLLHAMLDQLDERVLLLDGDGIVLYVNQACRRFAGRASAGLDYGQECRHDTRWEPGSGAALAAGIVAVGAGRSAAYTLEYLWHDGATTQRYRVSVSLVQPAPQVRLMVRHSLIGDAEAPSRRRRPPAATPAPAPALAAAAASALALRRTGHSVYDRRRPGMLELGLEAALEWLARDFRQRSGVACQLRITDVALCRRIGGETDIVLYRVLDEALRNVQRHAGATRVEIELGRAGGALLLFIRDDGIGFTAQQRQRSLGLDGMAERVTAIGGTLQLGRYRKGGGSRLTVRVPLALLALARS
jgi:PAS domain S-box-containing protein